MLMSAYDNNSYINRKLFERSFQISNSHVDTTHMSEDIAVFR